MNPFSFEFLLRPVPAQNEHQVIFQKRDALDRTVSLFLSGTTSERSSNIIFTIASGSGKLIASASIEKGKFSHICTTYDRGDTNKLKIFVSESLVSTSSRAFEFGSLSFNRPPLFIGSGSNISIPSRFGLGSTLTPIQTLSGALDEFRVFHSIRTIEQQQQDARKDIYASDDLKLYFKFNEPSGSFNIESVVLDSSGNSLHSKISNFSSEMRNTASIANPMTEENIKRCPVLFPSFGDVSGFNTVLLNSASFYDSENPNIITKMLPIHYLLEGQASQGLATEDGQIGNIITANSIPGSAKIGSAQYMTAFLFIWAKFFDEIKIFIDHFADVLHPDYDDAETVAAKFLPFVANYYGVQLPAIFPDTDPTQFIAGENIQDSYSRSLRSLFYIQTEIWRRILINLNEITRSKGTVHSVKAIIRAAGINPDSLMAIREYGGPTKRALVGLRQTSTEVANSLEFSGSLAKVSPGTLSSQGISPNKPFIMSAPLSSSRVEVGFPEPVGTFVHKRQFHPHGISDNRGDGMLTSGSFTYEAIYQFPKSIRNHFQVQSLIRLHVTGAAAPASTQGVVANLTVVSGTQNSLTSSGSTLRLLQMFLLLN